jgi:hypothetical protein
MEPPLERLVDGVYRVFRPELVAAVELHDWTLVVRLRSDKQDRTTIADLLRLADALEVSPRSVSFWAVRGEVEIWVEVDHDTEPGRPMPLPAGRKTG